MDVCVMACVLYPLQKWTQNRILIETMMNRERLNYYQSNLQIDSDLTPWPFDLRRVRQFVGYWAYSYSRTWLYSSEMKQLSDD